MSLDFYSVHITIVLVGPVCVSAQVVKFMLLNRFISNSSARIRLVFMWSKTFLNDEVNISLTSATVTSSCSISHKDFFTFLGLGSIFSMSSPSGLLLALKKLPTAEVSWYFSTVSLRLRVLHCYMFYIPLVNTYCFALGHIIHLSRMSWTGNK